MYGMLCGNLINVEREKMKTITNNDIELIDVPGTLGLEHVGEGFIAIAPLCLDLGLVLSIEARRLARHFLTRVELFDAEINGQKVKVPAIHKDDLIIWLAWLEEDITETRRPLLDAYRKGQAKALKDHFGK